jgi:hypothetical protein
MIISPKPATIPRSVEKSINKISFSPLWFASFIPNQEKQNGQKGTNGKQEGCLQAFSDFTEFFLFFQKAPAPDNEIKRAGPDRPALLKRQIFDFTSTA